MSVQGRVFNVQRFSLQDGPGLRTTVFLKGCPLACLWCHNPESQCGDRTLVKVEDRCIRCGACHDAPGDEAAAEVCPTGAQRLLGRDVAVPDLVDEVLRDRLFFDESGGGVTFSGGEPLAQPAFLKAALAALRARGVATAIDTCGHARTEDLLEAAALADLVLYDLKILDDARHRALTGCGNALVLANLEALGRAGRRIWIRVPVVPGLNDGPGDMEAIARFASGIPGVERLDLLPFHATGALKFRRLGRDFPLAEQQPPSPVRMGELAALFRAHGLATTLGGTP